jgi:heptosyltransferase II
MPRVLIILPSWLGDCVMATPALRLVRSSLPGAFIGGLVRPGMDELLAGSDFFDEVHVERASGVLGPKFVAAKVRPRRYDAALLLTNSFSTALIARVAGIPRRIGYDRDGRGLLLTDRLRAPRRTGPGGRFAPVPAVSYYWHAARALLGDAGLPPEPTGDLPPLPMELGVTAEQEGAGAAVLARAGVDPGARLAILNPGGNNPAKRWPPDRFAAVADHLSARHGVTVLLNGSPAEAGLLSEVVARARAAPPVDLSSHGITIGALKPIVRRCALMVTNDTGPRHIAAAFGVPVVSLFGPTDPRWTAIPTRPGAAETVLVADPTLRESEVADDHPERCSVDRITVGTVVGAVDALLERVGA